MVTLQTLTVGQFQEIYKVQKSEMDEEEKMTEMVSILSGKTIREVEDMPITEFTKLANDIKEVLRQELPVAEPKKIIGKYGITYEPAKLNRGQYITVNHFMKGDSIDNCHLILASLTYDPKTGKHDADNHKKIAEDLQEANFLDAYSACVFFSHLFKVSISSLRDFLVLELSKKGKGQEMKDLLKDLDGFIMPNKLQTLKA